MKALLVMVIMVAPLFIPYSDGFSREGLAVRLIPALLTITLLVYYETKEKDNVRR